MLIHLEPGADAGAVARALQARGLWVERLDGAHISFRVNHPSPAADGDDLLAIDGVAHVAGRSSKHPRLDRHPDAVEIGPVTLGGGHPPVLMAGPCAVESEEQVEAIASRVRRLGARFLRGGAFKPRTSPYSFQGHGEDALKWLRTAADAHDLQVVTECLATATADEVAACADLVQVGSRNMHNYDLLRAVGATGRPVLLKRGMAATLDEWRLAAEYCLDAGARAVVMCERGIRSFDPETRGVLDTGAIAILSQVDHLPVIADPSHAAGRRDLVVPLARAALAAGACGLLIETHPDPGAALSDGPQALPPDALEGLMRDLLPAAADRRG